MTPTELADALHANATIVPDVTGVMVPVALLLDASHALRRLGADAATLTHRAEVAERSCEDAKRREQEASAKMQAMAQSESNKALRARAEAAEQSATLWRERCNAAEAKVREYDSWICWETNCGHIAKALDMIYSAEESNDRLKAERDAARFLSAGWKRLARHYQSCHLAGHACLRETHRAKGEQIAALRRARDDDAAYRSDLMEQCDKLRTQVREAALARDAAVANAEAVLSTAEALRVERDDLRAKLARAEGVVGVVRAMPRCECRDGVQCDSCAMTDREWNDAMRPIVRDCRAALATYEEG